MITLGIDIGTTHTKVLALSVERGRSLALEAAPTPTRQDADGDTHRPAAVLETVIELARSVVSSLDNADEVAAICAASVGEEVVLLDAQHRPIGDTIAWYDPRGLEEAASFSSGAGDRVALSERWPPDPTFSIFKLMWIRDHWPAQYRAATTWTDLGDYVLAGLGAEPVMDWSHASRAGAFDLTRHAWDPETIGAAGLDIGFPRLVASGSTIGTVDPGIAERIGLSSEVAIVVGGHDHLCGAYGAGVRTTAELFLSAGTSEAHLALVDAPIQHRGQRYRIDQGCYVDADTYYVHVNIHSGHFFKQWRELLYADVDEDAMYAEVAAAPADSGGATFALLDDLRLGRLDRVPYGVGRDVLMRAILDGLADHSAEIIAELERACGSPFELVLAAGHPTRIGLWNELRNAAYGRPMAIVEEPETAAFGAAVIAARAVGGHFVEDIVSRRTLLN